MRWVFNAMNAAGGVPAACAAANPSDPALCIFAETAVKYLKTPTFPLQSMYDSWQQGNILFSSTPADVNTYGALLTKTLGATLLPSNPDSGVFLDACRFVSVRGARGAAVAAARDPAAAVTRQRWRRRGESARMTAERETVQ